MPGNDKTFMPNIQKTFMPDIQNTVMPNIQKTVMPDLIGHPGFACMDTRLRGYDRKVVMPGN
jgi:hypothetical protein